MKTKALLFISALLCGTAISAQDLAPGINYSYNPPAADGIITDIAVDVVNNDNTAAGSFDVAMYLYDMSSQTVYVIGTVNIPSLSGNSLIPITNWDIDINDTPGIPAGTYRLGVWVDSNDDISEADENDNAGLLSGNINYTPSASSVNEVIALSTVSLFPNPANDMAKFSFTLAESAPVTVSVYDMVGNLVQSAAKGRQLMPGAHTIDVDTFELPAGVYFVTVIAGEQTITRRLTVTH